MLPGIFLGYEQQAGGGWSGDLWVIDQEELAAAEHTCNVYPKRLRAVEVQPVLTDGQSVFPLAEGTLLQPGVTPRHVRIRDRSITRRVALDPPPEGEGEQLVDEAEDDERAAVDDVVPEPPGRIPGTPLGFQGDGPIAEMETDDY